DDAFEALLLGGFKEVFAFLELVLGVAHALVGEQDLAQQFFALQQGRFSQVEAIAIQQIEKVVGKGNGLNEFLRWVADAKTILEFLKIAASVLVQGYDFAVENCRARANVFEEILEFGELCGDVALGPGE